MSEHRHFLKDCKNVFPFIGKKEIVFLNRLKENMETYVLENGDLTYEELSQQFGTPKDIMLSYIEDCENDYIIKKMELKKMIKKISIIFISLLIIGLSIIVILELKTIKDIRDQNIIIEETILEQE